MYINKSIYIIYYPPVKNTLYSNGIIKKIRNNNYGIINLCPTESGASGSPILNIDNNRVIGIHKGSDLFGNNWNVGTFLKEPIEKFNDLYKNIFNENSIININNSKNLINTSINLHLVENNPNIYPQIS